MFGQKSKQLKSYSIDHISHGSGGRPETFKSNHTRWLTAPRVYDERGPSATKGFIAKGHLQKEKPLVSALETKDGQPTGELTDKTDTRETTNQKCQQSPKNLQGTK